MHKDFEPYVLSLSRDFTQVPAEDFQEIRSKFSIWFLLIAAQGLKLGHREFDRQKLQAMVGAQNYQSYSDFRRRVLEVAERELKTKTSVYFDWEVGQKNGKSPATIDLSFYRNKSVQDERRKQSIQRPELPIFTSPNSELMEALANLGISQRTATRLIDEESVGFLKWAIGRINESKTRRKKSDRIRNHEKYSLAIIESERTNYRAECCGKASRSRVKKDP